MIPNTVENLKIKMDQYRSLINDAIQKADFDDKDSLQQCVDLNTEINEIAKSLHSQFCELRADYNTEKVNLARYRGHLKPIKDFLVEREEPIKNPNLHLDELVAELSKHF
jgi:hypothetical protein